MSWWDDSVGYEVYIRSFADSDGDGIGDLAGITARLDHLAWLGVDVIWVTPFYPSPQADFGYDVADYTGVDPVYGDLAEFDRLVERAHQLGLRVMIDIVPNHTSSNHPWFRAALADPAAPERDYYIFRPPGPNGGPPNNWVSHFGGPAWTLDEATGEYYCHLFLPEQPDLNWSNEAVRQEFDAIIQFWIERGVEGFRIDVAHALMKHPDLPDNPQIIPLGPNPTPGEAMSAFAHLHDMGQETTKEIYRRWKSLPGAEAVLFLGEVYLDDADKSASYMGVGGLDLSLFFALSRKVWDPVGFVDALRIWSEASPTGFGWTIASHDENRPPSRFGGSHLGRRRALTLWTLLAVLPGMPFVYQGEELGLEDGVVAPENVQDPVGLEAYEEGRDPGRTPMPWEPGPGGGFTTGRPWLISDPRADHETVAVQSQDPQSFLHAFRRLLAARAATADQRQGGLEWLPAPPGVAFLLTGTVVTLGNLAGEQAQVDLPAGEWQLVYDPDATAAEVVEGSVVMPATTARIYRSTV